MNNCKECKYKTAPYSVGWCTCRLSGETIRFDDVPTDCDEYEVNPLYSDWANEMGIGVKG